MVRKDWQGRTCPEGWHPVEKCFTVPASDDGDHVDDSDICEDCDARHAGSCEASE